MPDLTPEALDTLEARLRRPHPGYHFVDLVKREYGQAADAIQQLRRDLAERDAVIAQVKKYADERAWYGARNRTVGSNLIASDLLAILSRASQGAAERPGQPGKNGGERAGLVGRESSRIPSVAAEVCPFDGDAHEYRQALDHEHQRYYDTCTKCGHERPAKGAAQYDAEEGNRG